MSVFSLNSLNSLNPYCQGKTGCYGKMAYLPRTIGIKTIKTIRIGALEMPKYEDNRPWRGWYDLKVWIGLRSKHLSDYPLCQRCFARGVVIDADVVNHRIPHKGDWLLFIDYDNLESVCKACHDGEIQSEERVGFSKHVGNDGWPTDVKHPFNRRR